MFRAFRDRFGAAGLAIAIAALILAIGGTALAASGALTAKQKKEVKKIAKSYQGTGPQGAKGEPGTPGANGKDGANGTNGKSAEAIPFSGSKGPIGGVTCTEGGLEVKSASATTLVCNGAKGADGTTGFTETLPPGATETGSVAGVSQTGFAGPLTQVPISFSIPLAAALDDEHVFLIYEAAAVPSECENASHAGAASAENPEAGSGYLCVYLVSDSSESTVHKVIPAGGTSSTNGASATGAYMQLAGGESGWPFNGSWAVTG
jgi:hypothetical protein